ncbi:DNA translocase FtsK 4TM domain-containing protein [Pseudoalteromonas sp. Cnat2-41]|uniref:DNA translocase FtsK n=1 Tax=unclassified Pseudoalteromonas TaxID=194690 RepID=UPI001EF85EAD|nr:MULTISPECIES: DNA translocase FtsK [unclassified Pseudoalteromonas]MCF2861662.1 DNA translocase FtsK 4TM domain-containing protein [Pseudoalteromonas sp. CNAT2-18]MCG7557300.1 DNA translocase FtsK 4TM domain-containing protein [Pseudoalteromonas sp. CNAT2-18.1]
MRLNGVQRLLETGLIVSTALAIFILCALVSFDPADPSWSQTGEFVDVKNITGTAGAWVADILLFSFGWLAFLVPAAIQLFGYLVFKRPHRVLSLDYVTLALRLIGLVLFTLSACAISSINFDDIFYFSSGGVVGDVIAGAMMPAFNFTGTSILLLCFFFAGMTLLTGVSWVQFVDTLGAYVMKAALFVWQWLQSKRGQYQSEFAEAEQRSLANEPNPQVEATQSAQEPKLEIQSDNADTEVEADKDKSLLDKAAAMFAPEPKKEPWQEQSSDSDTQSAAKEAPKQHPAFDDIDAMLGDEMNFSAIDDEGFDTVSALNELDQAPTEATPNTQPQNKAANTAVASAHKETNNSVATTTVAHTKAPTAKEKFEQLLEEKPPMEPLPSLDLLDRPDKQKNPISEEELEAVSRLVESKLQDFGVQASVVGVYPGPVVTRFELDLAPGVKVAKISGLSKDLARSLSAVSVRVVEVIPGKTYVGLELPNKHREIVRLSEVINAPKFEQNKSPLTMVLGKDIAGQPVVADLAKMPHLLVAGTTGSGKSVGVNVMILSLLYKSPPEDVRMIMIDPKMLELSVYEGIPHLLCEVVTDMKEAANALRWCVGEMERRYKLMSALGVRNLKGYNQKVLDAKAAGEPILDPLFKDTDGMADGPQELDKLPSIVVVIDEFADMMMIVGKKVEELIARIAQKARAAGIHLVLATQRPSVDVITGLIKANIPTRMAFQVSSKIDSRTILDQQGAEHLLGMGDMLYLPPGTSVPIRVHGAFVDDHEVHAVVSDWKARGKPDYVDEILNGDAVEDVLLPGETSEDGDDESDPLYDEACAFVIESGRVSVSSVQRKLRVGYNRAARLVEQMEHSGLVSSPGHNGAREVLVKNNAG